MLNILDAFEGKISLSEILAMDLSRLYGLLDAKNKINKERAEAAKKVSRKNSSLTMPGDINSQAPPESLIHEE